MTLFPLCDHNQRGEKRRHQEYNSLERRRPTEYTLGERERDKRKLTLEMVVPTTECVPTVYYRLGTALSPLIKIFQQL